MRPGEDEFGLQVAAKAADRESAARQQTASVREEAEGVGLRVSGDRAHVPRAQRPGHCGGGSVCVEDASRPSSSPRAPSFRVIETTAAAAYTPDVSITSVDDNEPTPPDGPAADETRIRPAGI
jgi:hypothetical protein